MAGLTQTVTPCQDRSKTTGISKVFQCGEKIRKHTPSSYRAIQAGDGFNTGKKMAICYFLKSPVVSFYTKPPTQKGCGPKRAWLTVA